MGVPDATLIISSSAGPSRWVKGPDTDTDFDSDSDRWGMVRKALMSSLFPGQRSHGWVAEADTDEHRVRLGATFAPTFLGWGERCAHHTIAREATAGRRANVVYQEFQKPRRRRRSTSQK